MRNEIILGDCREYLDQIPSDAFFISDPPYNQNYHYSGYDDKVDEQEYRDLLYEVFEGRKSAIVLYPEETIRILATLDIGKCEEVVSWVYPSNTAKQSRLVSWWGCKPDFRKIGQPYKNPTDKRIAKRIAEGKQARGYDWWEINQVKNVSKANNPHSCPIPDELARRIILSTTKECDLVVDPFAGSGTVCRVAKELGRDFIGFEISPEYHKYAQEVCAPQHKEITKVTD